MTKKMKATAIIEIEEMIIKAIKPIIFIAFIFAGWGLSLLAIPAFFTANLGVGLGIMALGGICTIIAYMPFCIEEAKKKEEDRKKTTR